MDDILSLAKQYCVALLHGGRCDSLPFHNVEHTLGVYENALLIGRYEGLSKEDLEPVLLASLFHDVGNTWIFEGHEVRSSAMVEKFLKQWDYPESKLAQVLYCIKATKMPQSPNTLLERIICDADLFHLGTKSFFSKNALLRKEWRGFQGLEYPELDWILLNITFLEVHCFFTPYGQEQLEPVKQENLAQLKVRLRNFGMNNK